jgi:recombination protein RecA
MPRKSAEAKKAEAIQADKDINMDTIEVPVFPKAKTPVDVTALVKAARGRYGKKEAGIAMDLTTGDNILLSDKDEDYIVSPGVKFWKPLTGIKGIPYGRIVQIAGRPDSGKSTTAMMFMKAAQDAGALVILWDSELKFSSRRYQNSIGGDPASVLVVANKSITEGAKQVSFFIKEAKEQNPNCKIFVVWDSVGASLNTTEDVDDDDNEDYSKQPGVSAKQVKWAIKKLNAMISRFRDPKTGAQTLAVCLVNQVYSNIGSVGYKEAGGDGLYYFSSIILNLARKSDLSRVRQGLKIKYGIVTRAKVKKNHLFDGEDCIAEMDLVVSADGIELEKDVKSKADKAGITGWDDPLD